MSQSQDVDVSTGDLLLFSGRGLASWIVRIFTRSRWSHIGMVVILPEHPQPLLLESTSLSQSIDITLGRPVAGVALVPLHDTLQGYRGEVALRRRQGPPLTDQQQRLLTRLVSRLLHRPYKNFVFCHLLDLLSGFPRRKGLRGLFCSELVAELYQRLGWLPAHGRARDYVPGHFGSPRMRLSEGALAELQLIKPWPATASAAPVPGTAAIVQQIAEHGRLLPQQSHDDQSPRTPAAA